MFFFSVFNALFVLIVFMLTLHKDTLHIDWPFGIKENITITEDEQVNSRFILAQFGLRLQRKSLKAGSHYAANQLRPVANLIKPLRS